MIGFFVVVGVGLFAALAYVLARRARRTAQAGVWARPSTHLRLPPPGARANADVVEPGPSTAKMVDVTPRGTSIKV